MRTTRPSPTPAKSLAALLLAFFALLAVPTAQSIAAPEPAAIPSRWEFDIEPGDLRVVTYDIEGVGTRTFYYWTYTVTNNTGEDRPLTPAFELFTDDGSRAKLARSGRDVPRQVTEKILDRIGNPLLLDEVDVQTGLLLQGPENAREGLVVWPLDRFRVDDVVIFAKGFSGETERIARPDTGERYVLRKSLMLRHQVDGTVDPTSTRPLTRTVERWILR